MNEKGGIYMDDKQIRIAIRVPQELKDEFQEICKKKYINGSELLRHMIIDWIEKNR